MIYIYTFLFIYIIFSLDPHTEHSHTFLSVFWINLISIAPLRFPNRMNAIAESTERRRTSCCGGDDGQQQPQAVSAAALVLRRRVSDCLSSSNCAAPPSTSLHQRRRRLRHVLFAKSLHSQSPPPTPRGRRSA